MKNSFKIGVIAAAIVFGFCPVSIPDLRESIFSSDPPLFLLPHDEQEEIENGYRKEGWR